MDKFQPFVLLRYSNAFLRNCRIEIKSEFVTKKNCFAPQQSSKLSTAFDIVNYWEENERHFEPTTCFSVLEVRGFSKLLK